MVQHARGFDEVEAAAERAELEDIRLAIFDIAPAELMRLALGIGEAGQAQVQREHGGAGEPLCRLDRVLARAAARDQNVNLPLAETPERGGRQSPPQVLLEQDRLSWRLRLRPAGIRILLVLLSHLARDVVLDRRQRRN